MNLFNKDKPKEHKLRKYDLSVSVLNSEENWVQLPGFDISVSKALSIILEKLQLPKVADENNKMKYFLYRASSQSEDGYEILAENDKSGNPIILTDYNIHNGIRLFIGALVLPSIPNEINLKTVEEHGDNVEDEDDEIIEI